MISVKAAIAADRYRGMRWIPLLAFAVYAGSAEAGPLTLGLADSFAILAASTVTNTGPSVVDGDLGLWAGTSITGFPPGLVNGTTHDTDSVAMQAQGDLTTAYNAAAGLACGAGNDLSGQDLGGLGAVDGNAHFERPGRSQCVFPVPDRKNADDRERLFGYFYQRRWRR